MTAKKTSLKPDRAAQEAALSVSPNDESFPLPNLKYSKDADILLITLREGKPADSIDPKEGVILHLDNEGLPLEIEILDAVKLSMIDEISVFTAFGCRQEELRKAI